MSKGKACGRPVVPNILINNAPACLMHIDYVGKDAADFHDQVEQILTEAGDAVADFTGFVFPAFDSRGRTFAAKCIFTGAKFTQLAYFAQVTFTRGVEFAGARFEQIAHFNKATLAQDADFHGATFPAGAAFPEAVFSGRVNFRDASFHDLAYFTGAKFGDRVDFGRTKFMQDAYFGGAVFNDELYCVGARFEKQVYFSRATFIGNADFGGTTFSDNLFFFQASFKGLGDFTRSKFLGGAEFRETDLRGIDEQTPSLVFLRTEFIRPEGILFYKVYLGRCLFHNCDVSRVSFSSVNWRERSGNRKRMVFEEDVELTHGPASALMPSEGSPDERDYRLIAELYQQLKRNYDDRKDYWTAGDFHYGEMEMKRLATPADRIPQALGSVLLGKARYQRVRRWLHQRLSVVAWYKYASQYGESYARPAILLGATLLLFALLFPAVGLRYDPTKDYAGNAPTSAPVVLTYASPLLPWQPVADRHRAQWRLFGNSCLTAVQIAAFQKDPAYQPIYARGRLLTVLETLLTSTLAALLFLAVNRQYRR